MRDRFVSKAETRQRLGDVFNATVDRLIKRGELPVVRVSERSIRIPERELEKYIQRRTERRGGR